MFTHYPTWYCCFSCWQPLLIIKNSPIEQKFLAFSEKSGISMVTIFTKPVYRPNSLHNIVVARSSSGVFFRFLSVGQMLPYKTRVLYVAQKLRAKAAPVSIHSKQTILFGFLSRNPRCKTRGTSLVLARGTCIAESGFTIRFLTYITGCRRTLRRAAQTPMPPPS